MVSQDNHLEEIFAEAPLVAFMRQTNIREKIIRTKVAPTRYQREEKKLILNGIKKCGSCVVCSYVQEGNIVKTENFTWTMNKKFLASTPKYYIQFSVTKKDVRNIILDSQPKNLEKGCANT